MNPQLLEGVKTKNNGELVSPAIPSELSELVEGGAGIDMGHLKGRWVLLHIDLDGKCSQACEKSVHILGQLKVLLNKDSKRFKRVYLAKTTEKVNVLLLNDTDLTVYSWSTEHIEKLSELVEGLIDGDMLLLDPLGNIMMKYKENADPYGVQKDLKLLFKASQIG
ncbi:MAG: hypothetical protein ABGX33_00105 [Cycloclasticus sp.]